MSAPSCRKCGRPLGGHHTPECIWEHTVVPSECDGIIEEAIATVKARGSADAKREAEAIARLRQALEFPRYSGLGADVSVLFLDDLRALLDEHTEALDALEAVLASGLNGGNNVRLAFLAARQNTLDDDSLAQAERSEQAVIQATAVLAKAGRR